MILNILILASIIILCLINGILIIALTRSNKKDVINSQEVKISVIIAAKNEVHNINTLINSLVNLEYSIENYEVIIVDDNSYDNTLSRLLSITDGLNNFTVVELKSSGGSGKRDALAYGIQKSKYPYILITDADCKPQPSWLIMCSRKFKEGNDLLFGIAPFYKRRKLVNKIACFENLRGSLLSFTMAKIGLPYTASARNFGFTKTAFEKLDGYENTKDTLSGDDDLLIREAVKNKLKIGVVTEPGSFAFSEAKETLKEYLQQKARHTQTSFHYLLKHQLILGFWHILNLFCLISPILMFINPMFGLLFPLKLLNDIVVVKTTQEEFSYLFSIAEILFLQVIHEIFLIINFFNSKFFRIEWK